MSGLAVSDRGRLAELEAVVERGLSTFVEVGEALMEIRDSRLYRDSHLTFEAYVAEQFGLQRRRAYDLIEASRVHTMVSQICDTAPARESHASELAPLLAEPDHLREAWAEVVALHPEPTAAQVREVVERHRRPGIPIQTEEQRQAAAEKQLRWAATLNVLDGLLHFDREAVAVQARHEAALLDPLVAATRGESITPARLRRASAWAALLADALEERTANA